MATLSLDPFAAWPTRTEQLEMEDQSAFEWPFAAAPSMPSWNFMDTGFEDAPCEPAAPTVCDSPTDRSTSNLDSAEHEALNTSPADAPYLPSANDDLAAAAQTATAVADSPAIQEETLAASIDQSIAAMQELVTQAIAIAAEPGVTEVTTEVTIEALHGVASPRETENTEEAVIALEPSNAPPAAEKPVAPDLLSFHKLKQQPFDVTPDPAFLYLSQSHREALTSLKDGIEHLRGFMMLVADPGMGKTTLLNRLMEELSESARIVFLFQTQCTSRELLCYILNELEVDHTGMDVVAMHRALNQALLEEMLRGRRFVLIVDEAQNLQEPVLETIRLLSDFETTHSKLIQIVLAGQPQLADTLMSDSLVQLRQRVAILAKLKSLSSADLKEYVEHRLRYAGCSDRVIFSSDALEQIAEKSQGVPRSVNNLCFNALFEAFHRGQEIVNADIVKEVAAKLNLESLVPRPALTAASQKAAPQTESIDTALLVRALAAALASGPNAKTNAEPRIAPEANASVVLTGNLMDKFRSQSSSKQHECRVQVSLERDASLGLPVADRYYCTTLYLSDEQAAPLSKGKPVRIKIEQD